MLTLQEQLERVIAENTELKSAVSDLSEKITAGEPEGPQPTNAEIAQLMTDVKASLYIAGVI